MARLTDAEVLARFMEPNPRSRTRSRDSEHGWWRLVGVDRKTAEWIVSPFTDAFSLDRLRHVEDRLTDEQWWDYEDFLEGQLDKIGARYFIHADAKQKATALAAVLRAEVEGRTNNKEQHGNHTRVH